VTVAGPRNLSRRWILLDFLLEDDHIFEVTIG
jgi:hypothetical protein